MTFTAVSPGQLVKASVTNANLRHVGRLGTDLVPMDNSGVATDGVQDIGTSSAQHKDLYMTGKIYVNGVEFKGGGGGGGGIALAEQQSHQEKLGNDYPLSDPGICNESYTNTANITLNLRAGYTAGGTTLVADINKTDIDLMEATTGWAASTGGGTVAQDTTAGHFTQGSASVKISKSGGSGLIDMVKTYTAFSLVGRQISFTVYLDYAGANLDYVQIILESTAGNTKSFRVPQANLTTGLNHITINPNTDTADASAGTFNPASITKIYLGTYTNTSQTVEASFDYLVSVDQFTIVDTEKSYKTFIWDGTNQEPLYINSVAGTGYHQRNIYTITALANSYTVAAAYAIQRNVTISGNQGQFKSGLSGAVAKKSYDVKTYELTKSVSNQDIPISWRFFDDEYKITDLPSTTTTKIYSATDLKAYFKTGVYVIAYQKTNNGIKYQNRYNSTITKNFKLLLLSADATYSGTDILLTHATTVNTGMSVGNWYVTPLTVRAMGILESMSANGALAYVDIIAMLAKEQGIAYPSYVHSHWKLNELSGNAINSRQASGIYNLTQAGTVASVNGKFNLARGPFTASNYFSWNAGGSSSTIYDSTTFMVEGWFKTSVTGAYQFIISKDAGGVSTNGWRVYISNANKLCADAASTTLLTSTSTYTDGNWHYFFYAIRATSGANEIRLYIDGSLNQQATGATFTKSTNNLYVGRSYSAGVDYFQGLLDSFAYWSTVPSTWAEIEAIIAQRYAAGRGREYGNNIGFTCYGKLTSATGSKLTTALEYSREDTTNQNPIGHQFDAYVPGLTE